MYIQKVVIENIRSIKNFVMEFGIQPGWHVLIGDNGAGKSTIIKSISLALIGPDDAPGLRADWRDWLNHQSGNGSILCCVEKTIDDRHVGQPLKNKYIPNEITLNRTNNTVTLTSNKGKDNPNPGNYNWNNGNVGWFSVAYGPYRRFEGGNQEWTKVFYSQPKLGAHLSAFGEDVALTEATDWLIKLHYQSLENKNSDNNILDDIKKLINSPDFLPHKAEIESISSEGVFFKDGNGSLIHVNQLSDGYRSILSLTFELIRQLVRIYGANEVFKYIRRDQPENMFIGLSGVVLIDEIDAHLHPTWQTRIGQWFTKYFPSIQFIVTTHSPLVCRACEHGSIWRLAAPGSNNKSGEITGQEKERLIFGNILDAYGTEIFGKNVSISEESNEKLNRLAELNLKSFKGETSDEEETELHTLKTIFPTETK